MNSKLIFSTSAIFTGVLGITVIFLPQETLNYIDVEMNSMSLLLIQLIGSLYFGFGMMNWMAKGQLAGGIYGRPIVIGNMIHFTIMSLSLIKNLSLDLSLILICICVLYLVFAGLFAYLLFTTPKEVKNV